MMPTQWVVLRVTTHHLLELTGLKANEADNGAVTLIWRSGSTANLLTIHLHGLALNGVGQRSDDEPGFCEPVFVPADWPTE